MAFLFKARLGCLLLWLLMSDAQAVRLSLLAEGSVELPAEFNYTYANGQLDAPSVILSAEHQGCKIRFESAGTIVPPDEFARLDLEHLKEHLYEDLRDFEPADFSEPELYAVGRLKAVRLAGSIVLEKRRRSLRVNSINLPHIMLHVLEYAANPDEKFREMCFNTTGRIIASLKANEAR
ncbi:MAG: hypothetical protein K6F05_04260 [Succinivibrio sp.]|nr:hypothetical protein [Succinivibrio sp.]